MHLALSRWSINIYSMNTEEKRNSLSKVGTFYFCLLYQPSKAGEMKILSVHVNLLL